MAETVSISVDLPTFIVYAKLILSCLLDGQPLLASGGSSGIISIWNLEKRRLQSVIQDAHDGAITSLHFLAKEPVLMSSAADNSIKVNFLLNYVLVIFFSSAKLLICSPCKDSIFVGGSNCLQPNLFSDSSHSQPNVMLLLSSNPLIEQVFLFVSRCGYLIQVMEKAACYDFEVVTALHLCA